MSAKAQPVAMYRVFISHSTRDTWVARQISHHIERRGAATFLDETHLEFGMDFERQILEAAHSSDEFAVLLTPWSLNRPYVWLEIGIAYGLGKRIVAIMHGLTPEELARAGGTPVLLSRLLHVDINEIEAYFTQLGARIKREK